MMVICKLTSKCVLALPLRRAIGTSCQASLRVAMRILVPFTGPTVTCCFLTHQFPCIHVNGTTSVSGDVCVSGDLDLDIFLAPKSFYTATSERAFVITP